MTEIVCQVVNRADQVEFVWSSRGGFFRPYVISGAQLAELRRAASGPSDSEKPSCREALERLVYSLNREGTATPWELAFELAEAGFRLFNCLLPTEDETARKVRRWLEDLRKQSGLICLEVVVEEQSADPRAYLSVPWNLVYDERPAKHKAAFQEAQGPERWRPFWSVRYNLTSGRRVEPLKRLPIWTDPRVVVVVDPTVRDDLDAEQRDRLDAFLAENGLPAVGSMDGLETALEQGYPRLLYWLGHATPEYLMLGDEQVAPADLRDLLRSFDDRERPEGMLAFLNGCQTAEAGKGGSFLDVLHSFGFTGAIATERQTIDNFASEFGLKFLIGFLREGKPLGELLHGLRLDSAPLGLLYGAHCPPEIRVRLGDGTSESPTPLPIRERVSGDGVILGESGTRGRRKRRRDRRPMQGLAAPPAVPTTLPEKPYRSLAFYDENDRPLFSGRDADVLRFAATLDRPDTRILILHGESGLGKSSFLRAGVIPYLERECVGYRFFRRPDGSLLIVQAAKDLVGGMTQALLDATAEPLRYDTPDGEPLTIDLRRELDEALGEPADFTTLREALRRNGNLLADVLARMANRLPHALVLVLDQAEDVFTLARTPEEVAGRDHALRMLQRLVDARADVKLIVSLRTEYYGRLLDHLRAGRRDLTGVRDDLLRDFSRAALIEAIARPTSETPLAPGQPSPRETYGFSFADGVPEQIADGVLAMRSEHQDSVLPLAQVICTQLYERQKERPGSGGIINQEGLDAIKGVEGGLQAFAEDALVRSMRLGPADREAFKALFTELYARQPDGTLTTWLKSRQSLERLWHRPSPFADLLESAKSVRLLREDELRIEGNEPRPYVRLGHDALAKVAAVWDEALSRKARVRRWAAAVAALLVISIAMGALALNASHQAELARLNENAADKEKARAVAAERAAKDEKAAALAAERAAKGEKAAALRTLYGFRMNTCQHAWERLETDRVAELLDDQLPQPGREDVRAFEWYYWWNLCHNGRLALRGHPGQVGSVAFSPDGKTLASASWHGTTWKDVLKLWDPATGLEKPGTSQGGNNVESVAFGPDGTIAWMGWDGLSLWQSPAAPRKGPSLPSGRNKRSIAISPDGKELSSSASEGWATLSLPSAEEFRVVAASRGIKVLSLVYSPDGLLLATGDSDGSVTFWDATEKVRRSSIKLHTGPVESVAFSRDGKTLASGGGDKLIKLVDVDQFKERTVLGGHEGVVTSVAFAPDGNTLASASKDKLIKLWDVTEGKERSTLSGHRGEVNSVAFSPDGRKLASGGSDNLVYLWDLTSVQPLKLPGPTHSVNFLKFSHDGRTLATVYNPPQMIYNPSRSMSAKLWDTMTGRERRDFGSKLGRCDASPDGRFLALSFNKMVELWDLDTMSRVPDFPRGLGGGGGALSGPTFSPDGAILAIDNGNILDLYDVASRKAFGTVRGAASAFIPVSFAVDNSVLVTGGWGKPVRIWNARTAARIGELKIDPNEVLWVSALSCSPDGRTVAVGYFSGNIELWDIATLRRTAIAQLEKSQRNPIKTLMFSRDGRTLVSASGVNLNRLSLLVHLWDVPKLVIRAKLEDEAFEFDDSAFSPDGKTLALKRNQSSLPKLWDVSTGREIGAFKWHTGGLGGVNLYEFSPNGKTMTTAGNNGRVIIWDVASFQEIVSLSGSARSVTDFAYSPDRRRLAAADQNGTIKIWVGATDREIVAHYEREARHFTDDSRAQVNLALACWGLSLNHDSRDPRDRDEARRRLAQGRDVLVRLRDARRLSEPQAGWIKEFDAALDRSDSHDTSATVEP